MQFGYTQEYLAEKSTEWVIAELRGFTEVDAREKQWDVTRAQLSHAPQTKEAASEYSRSVRDIRKSIDDPVTMFDLRRSLLLEKLRRMKE